MRMKPTGQTKIGKTKNDNPTNRSLRRIFERATQRPPYPIPPITRRNKKRTLQSMRYSLAPIRRRVATPKHEAHI